MEFVRPINSKILRPRDPLALGEKIRRFARKGLRPWAGAGDRTYAFDANNGLSDGVATYTASGYAQYNGADGFVDLGGNQNATVTLPSINSVSSIIPQQPRIDGYVVIDVLAAGLVVSGSALFKIYVVASNDPAFGATLGVACLGMLSFGAASAQEYVNGFVTASPPTIGGSRFEIGIANEQNNLKYEYLKLYNVVSGSAALGYRAFLAVIPEP